MDFDVLDHYLYTSMGHCYPQANGEKWDELCKDHAEKMGYGMAPYWWAIHFPFNLSWDNASTHIGPGLQLTHPRVSPIEEARTIDDRLLEELGAAMPEHKLVHRLAKTWQLQRAQAIQLLDDAREEMEAAEISCQAISLASQRMAATQRQESDQALLGNKVGLLRSAPSTRCIPSKTCEG